MTVKRNPFLFYLLAFGLSWVVFVPTFLVWAGAAMPFAGAGYNGFASLLSAFGPMAAALILLWRAGGRRAACALIRSGFDLRVNPLVLLGAVALPVILAALAHGLANGTGLDTLPGSMVPPDLGYPAILWLIPAFFSMLIFGGGQEEFGWRGYAQASMDSRLGPVAASLVIGAIWGLWHLPLWIVPGDPHVFIPFPVFAIFTMAFSVQMGWLYRMSGYRLSVPWIMHAVQNTVLIVFPVYRLDGDRLQTGLYLYVALNIAVAAIIALPPVRRVPG